MKKSILFLSLALCSILSMPTRSYSQAHSIKIDAAQDKDSLYIMMSDTVYSKYRHGKGKWINVVQDRNHFTGYKEYTAYYTQSSTTAPTVTVTENTLNGTVVWAYTSPGTYTGTLSGAFPAAKIIGNSGFIDVVASGDNTYSLQSGTDNTIVLKTYSDAGITLANGMLTAIPIRLLVRN